MTSRTTMNISVPPALKSWVDKQVQQGGFGTASEFIRHLIRTAKARDAARASLDDELEAGLDSGPATPMRASNWENIRREVRRRLATSTRPRRKSA
jgi:antitoxin ParD1/3/4